jgi:hypothetical protein
MVHAWMGQKVMPINLIASQNAHLKVIAMSETATHNINTHKTSAPWWWRRAPFQRRGFDETMLPGGQAALRIYCLRPLLKGLLRFNKLM